MNFKIISLLTILAVNATIFGNTGDENTTEKKLTFSVVSASEAGQFVRARYWKQTFAHLWTGKSILKVGINADANEHLGLNLEFGGKLWFNNYPAEMDLEFNAGFDKYIDMFLEEARGRITPVKSDNFLLDISLGYFGYKYNNDITNLGEYLFRTGTYPIYFLNSFDYTRGRISGAVINATFSGERLGIKFDQIFNMETDLRPYHDVSIASVLSVNAFKAVELGGGVNFTRALSVDKKLTMNKDPMNQYVTEDGDTGYYTFQGTKLMLRASLDPLFLLRNSERANRILGKGGKLYSELAWLGMQDYPKNDMFNPYGYDDISKKRVWMFGFTLPVPFLLDVCAFEFEYCTVPYQLDYENQFKLGLPLPCAKPQETDTYSPKTFEKEDNWKYSIYVKKEIAEHFALIGQISRDHEKYSVHVSHLRNYDFNDATVKKNEWLWHLKFVFSY